MLYLHKLSNNIFVVLNKRKPSRTTALKIFIRAGSRYDNTEKGLSGTAHLTEHLLFKSKERVCAKIESLGGRFDAGTAREYIVLSTVTLAKDLFPAIDILADIVLHLKFTNSQLDAEKLIVAEEINRRFDKEEILLDFFLSALFGSHPLENPVFGRLENLLNINARDINDFHKRYFTGSNLVLSICGDFNKEKALACVKKKFSRLPRGNKIYCDEKSRIIKPKQLHKEMELRQTHILMGFPAPSMKSGDRYPFKLIDIILGTGANSILYKKLREEHKLVYSIYSLYTNYEDAGYFVVKTSCSPANVNRVKQLIFNTIRRWNDRCISQKMIASAKKQYEGRLYRSFETNDSIASIFGIEALLNKIEPFERSVKKVNAVTKNELLTTAEKWLNKNNCIIVTAGKKQL